MKPNALWKPHRFDQMAHNINERVLPSDAEGLPYVGLEHLDSESLKIRRWGTPDEVEAQKLRFYSGDIIFGKRRFYQRKLAVADVEGICSAHAMVLRAKEDVVDPLFLPFFMQSEMFYERAMSISVGSLSPTINWSALARQEFPLPPLDEQRRIAEILWAVEDAIEEWERVIQSLRGTLHGLRQEKLCDHRFERQKLGAHLLRIVAGKSVVGMNVPATDQEVGVVKVSAVGEHGFVPTENKRLVNRNDFVNDYRVRKNDFLITRANTTELVGRVCIVPSDYPNLMLSDKTLRLEPKETLLTEYLLEVLRTGEVRKQIQTAATGTSGSMKNISQEDIRNLRIPVPPLKFQMQVVKEIKRVHEGIDAVSAQIGRLNRTKAILFENLLHPNEVKDVQ